jgi:hypothetical protein
MYLLTMHFQMEIYLQIHQDARMYHLQTECIWTNVVVAPEYTLDLYFNL